MRGRRGNSSWEWAWAVGGLAVASAFTIYYLAGRGRGADASGRGEPSTPPPPGSAAGRQRVAVPRSSAAVQPVAAAADLSGEVLAARPRRWSVLVCLNGALLETSVSAGTRLSDYAAAVLKQLAAASDLYLVITVDDDDTEAAMQALLLSHGIMDAGLDRRKVLFTSTPLGRSSIARQLEVDLYIESDGENVKRLQGHVPNIVHVLPTASTVLKTHSNVTVTPSLRDIWNA